MLLQEGEEFGLLSFVTGCDIRDGDAESTSEVWVLCGAIWRIWSSVSRR